MSFTVDIYVLHGIIYTVYNKRNLCPGVSVTFRKLIQVMR